MSQVVRTFNQIENTNKDVNKVQQQPPSIEQVLSSFSDEELLPYLESRFAKQLSQIVDMEVEKAREQGLAKAKAEIERLNAEAKALNEQALASIMEEQNAKNKQLEEIVNQLTQVLDNTQVSISGEDEALFLSLLNDVLLQICTKELIKPQIIQLMLEQTLSQFSIRFAKSVQLKGIDWSTISDELKNRLKDNHIELIQVEDKESIGYKVCFNQGEIGFDLVEMLNMQHKHFLSLITGRDHAFD